MSNKLTDKEIKSNLEWLKTVGDKIGSVTIGKEFIPTVIDYINRLEAENKRLENTLDDVLDREPLLVERSERYAKAEAYKEFAEKVHQLIHPEYAKLHKQLDNLLKEMVGEDDV